MKNAVSHVATGLLLTLVSLFVLALVPVSAAQIASDATASELAGSPLTVIEFPDSVPARASCPLAAVEGGQAELANAFIAAILSPDRQAILARYGFER